MVTEGAGGSGGGVGGPAGSSGDAGGGDPGADPARLTAWVRGRVQGVGFRWWVRARALELGLAGSATNLDDGRVQVVAEGPRPDLERLLAHLADPGDASGRPGRVSGVSERWAEPRGGLSGFVER